MWFDEECETMMRYATIKQTLIEASLTMQDRASLIAELDAIVRKMVKPQQPSKPVYPLMNNKQRQLKESTNDTQTIR